MTGNIRTAKDASQFLQANRYEVTPFGDTSYPDKITYRTRTGDGSWEGTLETPGVGPQNSWMRVERGACCPQYEKAERKDYCGGCGNGISGNITWKAGDSHEAGAESELAVPEPINQAQRAIRAVGSSV